MLAKIGYSISILSIVPSQNGPVTIRIATKPQNLFMMMLTERDD